MSEQRGEARLLGELIGRVDYLAAEVSSLRRQVGKLDAALNTGRGALLGLVIAAGSLGAGATHLLERLIR